MIERNFKVGMTVADPFLHEVGTVKSFQGTQLTIKWPQSTDIVNVESEFWQPWLSQLVILGEQN